MFWTEKLNWYIVIYFSLMQKHHKTTFLVKISAKKITITFQEVAKTKALDRLTDASKYGGTHRNRFSADGKGRGKEGRMDAAPAKLRE